MISILAFPATGYPYAEMFYGAMKKRGVRVVPGVFSARWLLANAVDVDFLHFHWPSFFYARPTRLGTLHSFAVFLFMLGLARQRGIRILWTAHNLMPHQPTVIPGLDRLARKLIVRLCDRVIIHGKAAETVIRASFPGVAGRTTLIPHGHYMGYYPDTLTREQARAELGIGLDRKVLLFAGVYKPYKNLKGLLDIFGELPAETVLVIASRFHDKATEEAFRQRAFLYGDRVIFHPGYIPNDKFQLYFAASDVFVTPYLEILSSGMALLGLGFGRPVVAPYRGALIDEIDEKCGILYDLADQDGLRKAIEAAMQRQYDSGHIKRHCDKLANWDRIADTVLRDLVPLKRSGTVPAPTDSNKFDRSHT